jgi:EAL domain-containing protein (putative c-di-GMP-specific phosphodiesterase class I)
MESIVYAANNVSAKILEQLKKMGVRLSIDDFGMGNLNFAYLKNLSFDKIKIDKSLIKGVTNNKYDEAVVEAIIQMMNKLNIETLAEGVENEAQLNFLIKHHVKQVQGYFYSSPVDINVCEDLLEKQKSINEEI